MADSFQKLKSSLESLQGRGYAKEGARDALLSVIAEALKGPQDSRNNALASYFLRGGGIELWEQILLLKPDSRLDEATRVARIQACGVLKQGTYQSVIDTAKLFGIDALWSERTDASTPFSSSNPGSFFSRALIGAWSSLSDAQLDAFVEVLDRGLPASSAGQLSRKSARNMLVENMAIKFSDVLPNRSAIGTHSIMGNASAQPVELLSKFPARDVCYSWDSRIDWDDLLRIEEAALWQPATGFVDTMELGPGNQIDATEGNRAYAVELNFVADANETAPLLQFVGKRYVWFQIRAGEQPDDFRTAGLLISGINNGPEAVFARMADDLRFGFNNSNIFEVRNFSGSSYTGAARLIVSPRLDGGFGEWRYNEFVNMFDAGIYPTPGETVFDACAIKRESGGIGTVSVLGHFAGLACDDASDRSRPRYFDSSVDWRERNISVHRIVSAIDDAASYIGGADDAEFVSPDPADALFFRAQTGAAMELTFSVEENGSTDFWAQYLTLNVDSAGRLYVRFKDSTPLGTRVGSLTLAVIGGPRDANEGSMQSILPILTQHPEPNTFLHPHYFNRIQDSSGMRPAHGTVTANTETIALGQELRGTSPKVASPYIWRGSTFAKKGAASRQRIHDETISRCHRRMFCTPMLNTGETFVIDSSLDYRDRLIVGGLLFLNGAPDVYPNGANEDLIGSIDRFSVPIDFYTGRGAGISVSGTSADGGPAWPSRNDSMNAQHFIYADGATGHLMFVSPSNFNTIQGLLFVSDQLGPNSR